MTASLLANIPRFWFEQILQQHVTPTLKARPHHVFLPNGRVAVVIDVEASSGDPHQVDGRYYRRHNFNRFVMEHYEVKQMFFRTTAPDLEVKFTLARGDNTAINYNFQDELSQPVALGAILLNHSAQPAFHTVIQIGVHASLTLAPSEHWNQTGVEGEGIHARRWMSLSISSPPGLPVFKEIDQRLSAVLLQFHSHLLGGANRFPIDVRIMSPGFESQVEWVLHQEGQHLRILPPNHPLSR